jgi:hypothetical protein
VAHHRGEHVVHELAPGLVVAGYSRAALARQVGLHARAHQRLAAAHQAHRRQPLLREVGGVRLAAVWLPAGGQHRRCGSSRALCGPLPLRGTPGRAREPRAPPQRAARSARPLAPRPSPWARRSKQPPCHSLAPYQPRATHHDQHRRQVRRELGVSRRLHSLDVQRVPRRLVDGEGALLLQLQAVVGSQLDPLRLCQVAAAHAQHAACGRQAAGGPGAA